MSINQPTIHRYAIVLSQKDYDLIDRVNVQEFGGAKVPDVIKRLALWQAKLLLSKQSDAESLLSIQE